MSVILEAKHISKNFGLTQALKDVSVTIDEGEVIGLIGENGSGKSICINQEDGLGGIKVKEKAKAKEILQKIIPFLGIILMIIIFQVGGEGKLLTKGNINSILNQTVYIAIMAFGAIFVYSHGGMDLSYGGVIGFSVLVAILVANTGVPAGVVFITNILAALVWFVLNGVVSVYLQVSPFITSLCIMYMCRGILNTVCASQKYSIPVELFEFDNQKFKLGMLLGVFIICYILIKKHNKNLIIR